MKAVKYGEWENGARYLACSGKQMDIIEELTKSEFESKYPDVSTYGLDHCSPKYLSDGTILIDREWNGEAYHTSNGVYKPFYNQVSEDDIEVIGYYK